MSETRAQAEEARADELALQQEEDRRSFDADLQKRVNEEVAAWIEERKRQRAERMAGGGPSRG